MKPYDAPDFPPSQRTSRPSSSQESERFDAPKVPRPCRGSQRRSAQNVGDAWNKIASELERIDAQSSEYGDFENWDAYEHKDSARSSKISKDSTDSNDDGRSSNANSLNESARDSLRRAANALPNDAQALFDDDKLSEDYETRNKRRSRSVWRSGDWRSYQKERTAPESASSRDRQANVSNRSRSYDYNPRQRVETPDDDYGGYDRRRYEPPQNAPRYSRFSNQNDRADFTRRNVRRDDTESTYRRNGFGRDGYSRENGARRNDSRYNSGRPLGFDYERTDRTNDYGSYTRQYSADRNDVGRRQPPRRRPDCKPLIGTLGRYGEPLSLAETYSRRDDPCSSDDSLGTNVYSLSNPTSDFLDANPAEIAILREKSVYELIEEARRLDGDPRGQIVKRILREKVVQAGMTFGAGTLEILPDGFGFLRSVDASFLSCSDDVYVSPSQIRRFGLRCGLVVSGLIRPPKERERYFALLRIDAINGKDPNLLASTPYFDDLVVTRPNERLRFEPRSENAKDASQTGAESSSSEEKSVDKEDARASLFDASTAAPTFVEAAEASQGRDMRLLDLVAPIGFGQRALIVCPPRSGKTLFIRKMIKAALENYDDLFALVLLVKKRPEDITETRRLLASERCKVVGSTFDEPESRHVQVARTLFEKAKRMVEYGRRVVVFVDSLTRVVDSLRGDEYAERGMSSALQHVRKLFGSSRKIDGGGSLTVVGTALWNEDDPEAQIKLDALQSVSHATLWLDSELAEKNVWPPIDVVKSAARDCKDFVSEEEARLLEKIRETVRSQNATDAIAELLNKIEQTANNLELQRALESDSSVEEQ